MVVTIISTLAICTLLFLMIWYTTYYLPWKGLMDLFPEDIKGKAINHDPPFKTAGIRLDMYGFVYAWIYQCDNLWRLGRNTKRLHLCTVPRKVFDHFVWSQGI